MFIQGCVCCSSYMCVVLRSCLLLLAAYVMVDWRLSLLAAPKAMANMRVASHARTPFIAQNDAERQFQQAKVFLQTCDYCAIVELRPWVSTSFNDAG